MLAAVRSGAATGRYDADELDAARVTLGNVEALSVGAET